MVKIEVKSAVSKEEKALAAEIKQREKKLAERAMKAELSTITILPPLT